MVIRRFDVLSVAKILGVLYAILGFIFGALFALLAMAGAGLGAAASDEALPSWFAPMFGVGAIIIGPIFYGVMGAIAGAIGAALYNLVAGMVGGVRIEVE